jgi:hypothetical protein
MAGEGVGTVKILEENKKKVIRRIRKELRVGVFEAINHITGRGDKR